MRSKTSVRQAGFLSLGNLRHLLGGGSRHRVWSYSSAVEPPPMRAGRRLSAIPEKRGRRALACPYSAVDPLNPRFFASLRLCVKNRASGPPLETCETRHRTLDSGLRTLLQLLHETPCTYLHERLPRKQPPRNPLGPESITGENREQSSDPSTGTTVRAVPSPATSTNARRKDGRPTRS